MEDRERAPAAAEASSLGCATAGRGTAVTVAAAAPSGRGMLSRASSEIPSCPSSSTDAGDTEGGTDAVLPSGSATPAAPGPVVPGSLEAPAAGTGALAVISAIVLWQVYTGMDFRVTSG